MSKHTPTPWSVFQPANKENRPGINAEGFAIVIYGDHEDIADDAGIYGRTTEESHANAEFIVRAANAHNALLAALHRLVSIRDTQRKRESEEFHISVETFMAMWDEADAEARAAIALAQPK